jgi:cytochrome c oxidase subunit 2
VKKHALLAFLLWAVLTAVGEVVAVTWDYFPLAAAREADIIDDAFYALVVMSVPVVAFVLAVMIYSILRFSQRGEQLEDGPPIHSNRRFVIAWFTVTSLLTVVLMIFPGTLGLLELRDHSDPVDQLVVEVQSSRWIWILTYPKQGLTTTEMVLPIGREVRFEVTSTDVLHAFWVPAFRMKIDAVPGQKTFVYATPTRTGTFDNDPGYRLQCAELCGLGHSAMRANVRVVEPGEFEAWVAENKPSASLTR